MAVLGTSVYHQTRKGAVCIHSDQTRKLLTMAGIARQFEKSHPSSQVMLIGSQMFADSMFNEKEFRRMVKLSETSVLDSVPNRSLVPEVPLQSMVNLSVGISSAIPIVSGVVNLPQSLPPKPSGTGDRTVVRRETVVSADEPTDALLDWSYNLEVIHKLDKNFGARCPRYFHPAFAAAPAVPLEKNVLFTLPEVCATFGLSSNLQDKYFTECCRKPDLLDAVLNNLHDSLNGMIGSADKSVYIEGCLLYPRRRRRPLYTYPVEERDRVSRLRPLFNTVLIVSDVDRLFAEDPDRLSRLIEAVRAEPTCRAFYFMSDFYGSQLGLVSSLMESLCLPQPKTKLHVEAYSVARESWVTVDEVHNPGTPSEASVRVRLDGQPSGSSMVEVHRSMIRRTPVRIGRVTSPAMLSKYVFENHITISVMFPTPVVPCTLRTIGPDETEQVEAYTQAAAAEGDFSSLGLNRAIARKLDLIGKSVLSNVFGKHLVVSHNGCAMVTAKSILARFQKSPSFPQSPRGLRAWRVGRTAFPDDVSCVLCVIEDDEAANRVLSQPPEVLSSCLAFIVPRCVFESAGLFQGLGIRHVYLMDHRMRVTVFHATDGGSGLSILHVWDYVVHSVPNLPADQKPKKRQPFIRGDNGKSLRAALQKMAKNQPHLDAYALLEDIVRKEKQVFGSRYQAYLTTGASIEFLLHQLRSASTSRFDPQAALDTCRKWRARNDIGEKKYVQVLSAVQAIFGSDLFLEYNNRRRKRRCDNLLDAMRVNAILLFNISRELEDIESAARLLVEMPDISVLSPAYSFRVWSSDAVSSPELSMSQILDHVRDQTQGLNRLREIVVANQEDLWSRLLTCNGLLKSRYFVFNPVGCSKARSRALSAAAHFQRRMMAPQDDRTVPLLFGIRAPAPPKVAAALTGGFGRFRWDKRSSLPPSSKSIEGGVWPFTSSDDDEGNFSDIY